MNLQTILSTIFRQSKYSFLSLASQALGLLQVALLIWPDGGGLASDAYFLLTAWGMFPAQIILFGVMFPLWLRNGATREGTAIIAVFCVVLAAGLATIGSMVFLISAGKHYDLLLFHTIVFTVYCVLQTVNTAFALRSASTGNALWLSILTLPSSVCACTLLIFSNQELSSATSLLGIGLCIGSVIYTGLFIATGTHNGLRVDSVRTGAQPPGSDPRVGPPRGDSLWFFGKSVSGYGAGLFLQTVAATLPQSSLTTISVVSKIVGGFTSVVTSTNLPRLINATTKNDYAVTRFVHRFLWFGSVFSFIVVGIHVWFAGRGAGIVLIAMMWLVVATISATEQRVYLRFRSARWSSVSIFVSAAVVIFSLVLAGRGYLNVSVVLGLYVLLDFMVALVLLSFRRKGGLIAGMCGLLFFVLAGFIYSS
ncbi:hypothetical protein [Kocuria rosea]|uniref:hypothetical protein n=1 Tax=Kocuria rosea TaxID=1275 RepID=UPI00203A5439|nr:hypothetical protein [Kocuria rosea]